MGHTRRQLWTSETAKVAEYDLGTGKVLLCRFTTLDLSVGRLIQHKKWGSWTISPLGRGTHSNSRFDSSYFFAELFASIVNNQTIGQ